MLETYAVGVKLEMASNVSGVLDRLMRDVERFNTLVKEGSSALDRLGRDLRELRSAGSSVNSLIRAMEKLNTVTASTSGVGAFDKMAEATRNAEAAASAMTRVLRENATLAAEMARSLQAGSNAMSGASGGGGRGGGGHGSSRFSEHNVMMAGMGAGIVGGALLGGVRATMTPAIDVSRSRDVLAADMRLTPDQVDAALEAARATTKAAPGSTVGENMGAILDLKNVFGDLGEALKMLPKFAGMSTLFSVLDRKGGGSGDQAFAAAKAMEIMGAMIDEHLDAQGHTVRSIDPELGMKRLGMMERVAVATNMRVQPSDYLGFAKQARVAGMTLSDEFVYEKLPAIMQVLGGPRTGTALMSMAQVFEGGKLTNKSMGALIDIGLASAGGLTKVNGKTKVNTEAIYDLDMMRHDPQRYVELAQQRMEAKGIHGTESQVVALMKASQRSTIAGLLADLLKDMPAILKEQQNIWNTRPDMAEHMAAMDPAAKVQQFEAALTNLATELGSAGMGDAMKVLDAATAGLNKLGEWAHNNPGFARIAFDAGAGLGAIATGLGALSTAILVFGPALKLLGGGGAAVRGAAAAAAGTVAAPEAALAIAAMAAIEAGRDPNYGANVTARDIERGRAGAAAAMSSPSSAGFVPADGFGVDGRPLKVEVVNGHDLARGVTDIQTKQLSRPSTGTTGGDPRSSPDYGLLGVGP